MATPNYDDILRWKYSASSSTSFDPYRDFGTFVDRMFQGVSYDSQPYQSEFLNKYLGNFPMEKEYQDAERRCKELTKDIDDMIIKEILKAETDVDDFKKEYMFDPKNLWSEPICFEPDIVPNVAPK